MDFNQDLEQISLLVFVITFCTTEKTHIRLAEFLEKHWFVYLFR